jgi:hypothetical protein
LLLKMPGRNGVLTLRGDLKKSYDCNQEAIQYASTSRVPDASAEVLAAYSNSLKLSWTSRRRRRVNRASSRRARWLSRRSSSKKAIHLRQPSSARAWVTNRNSRSSVSCGLTETYSHGSHRICQGCPRS